MKKGAKYRLFNSKLTSAISISMVLLLVGAILIIGLGARQLSAYFLEHITLTIYTNESATQEEFHSIDSLLSKRPYTKQFRFISKEEGLATLCEEMGENIETFKGHNPLPNIYEVNLKANYANNDSILFITREIEKIAGVKSIEYPKTMTHLLASQIKKVAFFLFCATCLLLLISFILINNTIQLLIHSDRFLIHTMRLVGATKNFIRKPYIKQALWIGLCAFLFTMIYMLGIAYLFRNEIGPYMPSWEESTDSYMIVIGALLAFSIIIPVVAAIFSVNKYLRRSLADLYLYN